MSKIIFKEKKVNEYIIPKLNDCNEALRNIKNNLSILSIPTRFKYIDNLKKIISDIGIYSSEIKEINNKINNSIELIKKAENKSNNLIESYSINIPIKEKINSVKNAFTFSNKNGKTLKKSNNTIESFLKKTVATIANGGIGFFKGKIGISDQQMSKFYETNIGKWLNENSDILFKKNGEGFKVCDGIGIISKIADIEFDRRKKLTEQELEKEKEFAQLLEQMKIYSQELEKLGWRNDHDDFSGIKSVSKGYSIIFNDPYRASKIWGGVVGKGWDTLYNHPLEGLSTVGSISAAFTGGLIGYAESFADAAVNIVGADLTPITFAGDLIGYATGNDWGLTKGLWSNGIKPITTYSIKEGIADIYYSGKGQQIMNDSSLIKRGDTAYQIAEQAGTISGNIITSGGVSTILSKTGLTSVNFPKLLALISGTSAYGRYSTEEFNKNNIVLNYYGQDLEINIDFNKYKEIVNLEKGKSIELKQTFPQKDGNSIEIIFKITAQGNGKYKVVDQYGNNVELKNINESNTVKGIAVGGVKALWEACQYYVGAKVNASQFNSIVGSIKNPVLRTMAQSGIRVGLDTLSGALDTPFFSLVTAIADNKSYEQAWEENGGTNAMIANTLMGTVFSAASELPSISSAYKGTKIAKKINTEGYTQKNLNNISKLKGYGLKSYVEESIKNGTFEETFKFINKQELNNIEDMFNPNIKQQVNNTKIDYKIHIEDNILTSNLQNQISQEQLEYMKNLKGNDLEAFMTKASLVGKLDKVINYLDENEVKRLMPTIKNTKMNDNLSNLKNKLTIDQLKYKGTNKIKYSLDYLSSNIKKYVYNDTNKYVGLNDEIKNNGLYHFTSEKGADAILKSGYIKSSDMMTSYGNKKTFFFNGVPDVGSFATNIDDLPLKAVAVKVEPSNEIINSSHLKIRNLDDHAITYDGNFNLLNSNKSTKEYFCLFLDKDELIYKNVTKTVYDNYQNTNDGKKISEFLNNKKNIGIIKADYYDKLYKNITQAKITSNPVSIVDNTNIYSNNIIRNTINELDKIEAGKGSEILKQVSETGNYDLIPDKFYKSLMQDIPPKDIKKYLNEQEKNKLPSIKEQLNKIKLSNIVTKLEEIEPGTSITKIRNAIETKDYSAIPNDKQIRYILKAIPDDYKLKYVCDETIELIMKDNNKSKMLVDAYNKNNYSKIPELEGLPKDYISEHIKNYVELVNGKYCFKNDFFEYLKNCGLDYGVDQAAIEKLCTYELNGKNYTYKQALAINKKYLEKGLPAPQFIERPSDEFIRLQKKLIDLGYAKDYNTAHAILNSVDYIGACSYADMCNDIFDYFQSNPVEFKKIFGYDMIVNINGVNQLNSAELMLDIFLFVNDEKQMGKLFYRNANGEIQFNKSLKTDIFGRPIIDKENFMSLSGSTGKKGYMLFSFLAEKGSNIRYKSKTLYEIKNGGYTQTEFADIISNIHNNLSNGKHVDLGIYYDKGDVPIKFEHLDSKKTISAEGGHAVKITGMTQDSFIVSSWGEKYEILFEDLIKGGKFNVRVSEFYK